MDQQQPRRGAIAAQRYQEMVRGSGKLRYAVAIVMVPAVVAIFVPGLWWLGAAVLLVTAVLLELLINRWAERRLATLEGASDQELRNSATVLLLQGSIVVSLYALPNLLLAFAPGAGPWIGYAFATSGVVSLFVNKTTTRAMMTLTSPVLSACLVLNGLVIGGWIGISLAAAGLILNTIANARAGALSVSELIDRQIHAENAALALEQRVEERTAELREAVFEAENANRAKSLFLANMSHELRTPLNAVINYTEIVEEDLESGETADAPTHLARVRGSATHLLGLITEVLDFSKMEAETLTLNDEWIENRALATEALETIASLAASNKTGCELIISPGAERLHADRLRVKQCLVHLLSNAAKFTQGGRIIVHAYTVAVDGEPTIAFEVSDTGLGIAKDVQPRLFQPFVQADDSVTRAYGGTGLGLSITRRLARLMGGDVTLDSEPGNGSRFTLLVPRLRQEETEDCVSSAA